jgi:hypothetical protein
LPAFSSPDRLRFHLLDPEPTSVNIPYTTQPISESGTDEMAQEPADQGGGVFIVKQVVFIVGAISVMAGRILRERLGSELDAVCARSHRKAELFRGAAEPLTESGGNGPGEDGLVTAADGGADAG